jgi:hypothetical protein
MGYFELASDAAADCCNQIALCITEQGPVIHAVVENHYLLLGYSLWSSLCYLHVSQFICIELSCSSQIRDSASRFVMGLTPRQLDLH